MRYVAFVLVLGACGGAVEGSTNTKKEVPLCSSVTTCSQGDTCRLEVPSCPGQPSSEWTCSCSNDGMFACPDIGQPPCEHPPIELCGFAGRVSPGESCPSSAKGETCESTVQVACFPSIPPLQCTCDGAKFVCDPPPMHCPEPPDAGDAGDSG